MPVPYQERKTEIELYDLEADIGEAKNLAEKHPEIVEKLQALAEVARDDLGDVLQKRIGKNIRPAGKL